MGLSSGFDRSPRRAGRTAQGLPLLGYERSAGRPSVMVERLPDEHAHETGRTAHAHAHDFLVLLYLVSGRISVRVDDRTYELTVGDAFVIAPGAVVTTVESGGDAEAWRVQFPADAVDPAAATPLVSWRAHPLLAPFVGSTGGGGHRLRVPVDERARWLARLSDLDAELAQRRDGYADAVRAHLTLLLVALGRLDLDVPFEPTAEPLLAAVFEVIETRYREPITASDVAAAVGHSSGHLTTVVGRRTGRTVGQWITERRMREARRMLADTDLGVGEIATRVGYRDPGYFTRRFRSDHGTTPRRWRSAGR